MKKSPPAPKKKKDDSFRDFILDALDGLPGLRSKAMFGGLGLYMGPKFFGIVWNGRLYFKVDAKSRVEYASRGSKPFIYSRDGKKMTMSYYEVPAELLEDHERLRAWAVGAAAVGK